MRTYKKYGAPAPVDQQPLAAGWRRLAAKVAGPAAAAHCPAAAERRDCAARCAAPTACQCPHKLLTDPFVAFVKIKKLNRLYFTCQIHGNL